MADRPTVLVCRGKGCNKRPRRRAKLMALLEEIADIEKVGCQKVCKGPLVGVTVDGRLEWFRRIDGDKPCRALVTLLARGKLKRSLKKRRVEKLSGKRR
jgi:hypothetical protein